MNEQLIKFIELCLADGVISDKEREVIFRKAKSLGVDEDECEILIDSYTQQVNKIPDNNKSVTSKPKRNFTPKTVEKIKPADLNKERKLFEEVTKLKEEEKKISANYDSVLEDLKVKTREVNKIKAETEVDFENFKKEFFENRDDLNNKYISSINQEVSKKFGNTEMILSTKEKTELSNLDLNKKKNFILKNSKWNSTYVNSKRRTKRNFIYLLSLLPVAYAIVEGFLFEMNNHIMANWVIIFIVVFMIGIGSNYNKKIKENTMNFTDDDIKSIIDKVNKSLKNDFAQLELKEKKINNYISLSKYDLSIPQKNKISHS
jgi:hypothetical protein